MSVASAGGQRYEPIDSQNLFTHPCTSIAKSITKPDSLSPTALGSVKTRIMRKAGYEKVSGNAYKPLSFLSKFDYFSKASRNMHSTARAYHESGHIVTAAFLREVAVAQTSSNHESRSLRDAENEVWNNFKDNKGLQHAAKRQDFLNHRMYMFDKGEKTLPLDEVQDTDSPTQALVNPEKQPTQGNRFSRIATKFSRIAMSVCECTSAPTGFTYRAGRNAVFHGVADGGQINKAGTVAASFAIGMGAAAIIKAIRGAASTGGYGFNPIQMLTGVLVAFAAVSGIAGGISWLAGLGSQAVLKNIDPSDHQRRVLQFDMDSTLNKINQLIITYKNHPTMLKCINDAMRSEMPKQAAKNVEITVGDKKITVCPLLAEWFNALTTTETPANNGNSNNISDLDKAKKAIGNYLKVDANNTKNAFNKEKEFAALAGLVEHFEVESSSVSEEDKKVTELSLKKAHEEHVDLPKNTNKPHTLKNDRIDARQFTEEFAQKINRTLLRGLAKPAVLLDIIFRTNDRKISNTIKHYASDAYAKNRTDSLKDPNKAHLHKYHAEYITTHLHQYGPITRALMKASDLIHNVNYNYILAVNAQTSRLYNKAAQSFQESVLGQHSSKIACSALGRFLGGATVTLVAFFGISSLAALTGGGSAAGGFQNSAQMGSAKMSWLVTGTLMTLVGLPAFVLGLAAKGAAALEGWKGNIDKPITQKMIASNKLQYI